MVILVCFRPTKVYPADIQQSGSSNQATGRSSPQPGPSNESSTERPGTSSRAPEQPMSLPDVEKPTIPDNAPGPSSSGSANINQSPGSPADSEGNPHIVEVQNVEGTPSRGRQTRLPPVKAKKHMKSVSLLPGPLAENEQPTEVGP